MPNNKNYYTIILLTKQHIKEIEELNLYIDNLKDSVLIARTVNRSIKNDSINELKERYNKKINNKNNELNELLQELSTYDTNNAEHKLLIEDCLNDIERIKIELNKLNMIYADILNLHRDKDNILNIIAYRENQLEYYENINLLSTCE